MTERTTSRVHRLLCGTDDTRLRASLRILIALVVTFTGALWGSVLVTEVPLSPLYEPLFGHLLALVAVLVAMVVLSRYVDHRPLSAYGFDLSLRWGLDVIAGLVVGIGLVGLAFVLNDQRGVVTVVGELSSGASSSFLFGVGVAVVGWLFVGLWEETIFRGLFLKNAAEGLASRGLPPLATTFGALLSSSLVYGFLHGPLGSNPDEVSLLYSLVMTSVMGGLFGLAYVLSGELALPVGLHMGINFAEHTLFFGPPDGVLPAVLRVEHAVTGERIQFQSIDPEVILPVFLVGYATIVVWAYLWNGSDAFDVSVDRPEQPS
ncbi:CPBP family intramembrane metalloprotease [Halomicrobium mukohataei]|uniref:CPBP family intramembrane metalloprotease n=1 Tax=Halomicrobium mukohataei TaxID=57705 RepID=A0A847UD67_9EURY|nr:CPBP family intramembrane metalloprotease [Halomicrobium mukohataei]